jgi:ketosteroid isomerase-like protein
MITNTIIDFVNAINSADLDSMVHLMAEDHIFIDSQDNRMTGRDQMKQAWNSYFQLFPDYKIEMFEIVEKDSLTCVFGYASGTYKDINIKSNYWRIPAAWRVVVSDFKISEWQVYADNIIVAEIINRNNQTI